MREKRRRSEAEDKRSLLLRRRRVALSWLKFVCVVIFVEELMVVVVWKTRQRVIHPRNTRT